MDQTKWQPRPSDPELEAEILQRLLAKFDASAAQPAATAAAAPAGAAGAPAAIVHGSRAGGAPARPRGQGR